MSTTRSKLAIAFAAVGVLVLACLGFCMLSALFGGESTETREANEAAIAQARVACGPPSVFRPRPGGRQTLPSDWECISPEQAEAETAAAVVAEDASVPTAPSEPPAVVEADEAGAPASEDSAEPAVEPDFWRSVTRIARQCPEELWAVIPNYVPASDEFERHSLEERRGALRTQAQGTTYTVTVRGRLGEYDFTRHRFPVEVDGLVACVPGIRIALGTPSVDTQRVPSRVGGSDLLQRRWQAAAVELFLPVENEELAMDLQRRTRGLLAARINVELAFRVQGGRSDVRMGRGLTFDRQDIGAGPMVPTRIVARRITVGDEVLLDESPD